MKIHPAPRTTVWLIAACQILACGFATAQKGSFYREPSLFSTRPSEEKSLQTITRFGPVGIGIELVQPVFTMKIKNIEEGSPAAIAAEESGGKLKAGQIIESINGQKLADIDPRIQLGQILAAAEAKDGVLKFRVVEKPGGKAEEVTVKIPILGAYSKTWPLDCAKSDKIVRGFAEYLAKPDSHKGFGGIGMLFLLSTGEEKDLEVVRAWARGLKGAPTYAWHLGYGGIPLTEYYLRTGDDAVLPTIQNWVNAAVKAEFLGGWAGRGGVAAATYGGGNGQLNAGGTAVVTFLMLAKECGADVNEDTLHRVLTNFFRFAGRGNNPYGNGRPESSFVDNGKNGNLAFAMAAAASLTPEGEKSIYAAARDVCAMTSFYTTTYMLHGHTGGGIGEIWRSAAMGLLHEKKPQQYRGFMDERQWHYDLSRRWDGSFGILGGARYDNIEWGAGYALAYTIPRKTLRITGAPPSKYSKKYPLPKRPWGTAADDGFFSLEAATDTDGKRQDMSLEILAKDSGKPLIDRLLAMGEIGDDVLRKYTHHPDHIIRQIAANNAMGIVPSYMWIKGGDKIRIEFVHELIRSKDPRVRRAGIAAMNRALPGTGRENYLTTEIFDLLIGMLGDSEESWWVKDAALQLVGRAPADSIIPHVDLLLSYLTHEEWWLQNAALTALAPVVVDKRCYKKVLPAMGEFLRKCERWNATAPFRYGLLRDNLRKADPEVQRLATETLKESYTDFAGTKTAPGGQDISGLYESQVKFLAGSLADVPGGYDVLYEVAKQRYPKDPLPYADIFLNADPERFGPDLKKAIVPIIRDQLVYQYIGKNRKRLLAEAENPKQSSYPSGLIDGLTELYRKVGNHNYDWHTFGPNLENAEWDYFTFDPPEKQAYDISPWRYREVTYPAGMENWTAPDFDPGKAGWKKGQAPFGQYKGKLVTDSTRCGNPDCRHAHPMRTLWEKEVLLMRGTFKFAPLKPGHLYRVRVGSGQHVGSGDGYRIYVNGKELIETKVGVGRRQGAKPRGGYITEEFLEEFNKGPVTIAATGFLRYGNKAIVQMPAVPQGTFSLWVEEMKLPPLGNDAIRKSATMIPMLSMNWQVLQDPDNAELQSDEDMFRWDGKFIANPQIIGTWKIIHQVKEVSEFDPEEKLNPGRSQITGITLKDNGETGDPFWIWSGDILMDLERNHALHMTAKSIRGKDYLFIESGGFSMKNPPGWKPALIVMERK